MDIFLSRLVKVTHKIANFEWGPWQQQNLEAIQQAMPQDLPLEKHWSLLA